MPHAPTRSPSIGRVLPPAPGVVHLIPLGGLGEVGMNSMILGTERGRILLDCGVTFAGVDADLDVRPLGVSIIHPDFRAVTRPPREPFETLEAIVLTHGHEDHIGALPFLLRDLSPPLPPIFGPRYALGLVEQRLHEMHIEPPTMTPIAVGEPFDAGPFRIEPYHVNHSIVDAMGLIVDTPAGVVVHSGDFKIEEHPMGDPFPADRLRALGKRGVALLMSDSTNIGVEGRSGDEVDAAAALDELIGAASGRVIVALFASNVYRMRSAFASARKHKRKVLLAGRSIVKHFDLARELGYLRGVSDLIVPPAKARGVPRRELLVLATGTQGEPPAALAKLARSEHRDLDLESGDTVILSSRVIPGSERSVYALLDALARRDIVVHHRRSDPKVHVSGHAHRQEQRMLLEWLKPRCFLPVHGTYGHLTQHGALARELGVDSVLVAENGAVIELGDQLTVVGSVASGRRHIAVGAVALDEQMRRDRMRMSELGLVTAALPADDRWRLTGAPRLEARGFLPEEEEDALLDDCTQYLRDELRGARSESADALEDHARRAIRRFFWKTTRRKPEVVAMAMRVRS